MSNPLVASLLGWIDQCLHEVARDLERQEKERRSSEEAKRLAKQAQQLAQILNNDFHALQMELEKIRRAARLRQGEDLQDLVPDTGELPTEYTPGGPEHGNGTGGELAGPGEQERPGISLLPGAEKGGPGKVSERRQKQSAFQIEYRREDKESPRSRYEKETRTIVINLDHPQIARAAQDGGIDGKLFKEITYEVAFVEYAIALVYEKLRRDPFHSGWDALYDIDHTIDRITHAS